MTVAVCLKCGAIKVGAWTPCPKCHHLPEDPEDQAKHMIISDHYFSRTDLDGISANVKNGLPVHFDAKNIADIVATLKSSKSDDKRVGLFVFGIFAVIVIVIAAAIYAITRFVSR